jgi:hypothetical protein
VQALGGSIAVESTVGVGTCFRIVLPRVASSATAARRPIAEGSRVTRAVA